jgi:hypothetical protein
MLSDNVTDVSKALNSLLNIGLPQTYMRGGIQSQFSTAPQKDFSKQVRRFNETAKGGFAPLGSDVGDTGISLPKLIGAERNVTAPVMYSGGKNGY